MEDSMAVLDFLKRVDIFKGLSDDQLNKIQPGCQEVEYHGGHRLFAEGENSDRVWIVTAGQVDLRFDLPGRSTSEENTIFSISAGNTLGWSSFVPPHQYKLSAYCATRVQPEHVKFYRLKRSFCSTCLRKTHAWGFWSYQT
jgi:CRP-like cAMP-binding protein